MVIKHNRISTVRRFELTRAAKSCPKRMDGCGSHDLRPSFFVIYRNGYVHNLHELGFARRTVCIRRHKGEAKNITRILSSLALEVQTGGDGLKPGSELLRDGVRDLAAEGGAG